MLKMLLIGCCLLIKKEGNVSEAKLSIINSGKYRLLKREKIKVTKKNNKVRYINYFSV